MEKKVIAQLDWGKCPKCNSIMLYLMRNYQAGIPGEGGTYITYLLDEDTFIQAVCPKCKFSINLVHTLNGICSKEHAKEHHYINSKHEQPISLKDITIPMEGTSNDDNSN